MDDSNTNPQQALISRLGQATNILVTVSSNPSVDGLAACLGMTLWLNKLGKHATAVFSGEVPSTLEFLQPEATLEKNTDSLRDFIIALDKSKADKLRYKVEDDVVKIFITPYRTSLSADDLEYSQGDFNVDMVIALGVASQQDLDTAITAHGRILHDATVATITVGGSSELGAINWQDGHVSSLSELVVTLGNAIGRTQLDGQIATALLTGIVAETVRFSNEKTSPQTMSVAAELMSSGANQQLVASKLEEPKWQPTQDNDTTPDAAPADDSSDNVSNDGTLEIEHDADEESQTPPVEDEKPTEDEESHDEPPQENAEPAPESEPEPTTPDITDVKQDNFSDPDAHPMPGEDVALPRSQDDDEQAAPATPVLSRGKLITEPPALGGVLTANSRPDDVMLEAPADPISQAATQTPQQLLDRSSPSAYTPAPAPNQPLQAAPADWMPPASRIQDVTLPTAAPSADGAETLSDIEASVHSPHLDQPTSDDLPTDMPTPPPLDQPAPEPVNLDDARDEVERAINSVPDSNLPPVQSLNAQPMDLGPSPLPQTPVAQPFQPPQPVPTPPPSMNFDPTSFDIMNDPTMPPVPLPPTQPPTPELSEPVQQPFTLPVPGQVTPQAPNPLPSTTPVGAPSAPPVPPPIYPQ